MKMKDVEDKVRNIELLSKRDRDNIENDRQRIREEEKLKWQ